MDNISQVSLPPFLNSIVFCNKICQERTLSHTQSLAEYNPQRAEAASANVLQLDDNIA